MIAYHRLLLPLLALVIAGCARGPEKPDPEVVAKHRDRFLSEVEPADPLTPLDWRDAQAEGGEEGVEELGAPEPPADGLATFVGQVGGILSPFGDAEQEFPFKAGKAVFFMVDPATVAEFVEHAGEGEEGEAHAADCPFCAREALDNASAVAVVMFSGEDGKPIEIDARDLFGLQKGDLVVVRGEPKLTGDLLQVAADELFIRK